MKMELSLTAPVDGRVREVLVSRQRPRHRRQAAAEHRAARATPPTADGRSRRASSDARVGRRPASQRLQLARARLRRPRRDVRRIADEADRRARGPGRASTGCSRSTPTCARSTARTRPATSSVDRQPAGAPARVPALARPRRRGPARPLRRAPRARRRPLRHRRPGAHGGARGRRLPAVPLAAAGGARRAPPCRPSSTAGSSEDGGGEALRGVLDRLEATLAPPRAGAGRAGARAALARRATSRWSRQAREETDRGDGGAPRGARRGPRAATTATRASPRSSTARSRSPPLLSRVVGDGRAARGGDDPALLPHPHARAASSSGWSTACRSCSPRTSTAACATTSPPRSAIPTTCRARCTRSPRTPRRCPRASRCSPTCTRARPRRRTSSGAGRRGPPAAVARVAFVLGRTARVDVLTFAPRRRRHAGRDARPARPAPDDGRADGAVAAGELRARAAARGARRLPVPRRRPRERARRAAGRARRGARPHAGARRGRPHHRAAGARADGAPGVRGDALGPVAPPRPPAAAVEPAAALRLAADRLQAASEARRDHRPLRARDRRARPRAGACSAGGCGGRATARCASSTRRAAASSSSSTSRRPSRCSRSTRAPSGSSPPAAAARCTRPRSSRSSRPQRAEPGAAIPPGEFVEHDLDDDGELVPVDRPPATNAASVVVGLIRNRTERYPEGMLRVALLGDPTRSLGSLAEPECRRIIAALDLAEQLDVPVEWFALSSGAKIAMDSGTENMDWVAAALRRIVALHAGRRRDQRRSSPASTSAPSRTSTPRRRCSCTRRGILVMTPDSAMVLTGKQALDYSGGVSAEDNFGIGGYDRVMGPNGQAQYWAPDLAARLRGAAALLRAHLRGAGRALPAPRRQRRPGRPRRLAPRRTRRRTPTWRRSARSSREETNPGRKKPFDIRSVMRAVIDRDDEPLERWAGMREAEIAVAWDARLGGRPVALLGIESRPLPRFGAVPADGPEQWTSGTLFPQLLEEDRPRDQRRVRPPAARRARQPGRLRRLAGVDAPAAARVRRRDRPRDRQLRRPDRLLRDLALPRRRVRGLLAAG